VKTAVKTNQVSGMNQFLFSTKKVKLFAVFSLIMLICFLPNNSIISAQTSNTALNSVDPDSLEVEYHNIKIDILNEQEVVVAEKYEIRNKLNVSFNSVFLWINQSLENLYVSDFEGELVSSRDMVTDSSNLLEINLRSELSSNDTTVINIWYSLLKSPIPEQSSSYYFFEFYSTITYFTIEQKIEIKIPERSLIHEEDGVTSFFPLSGSPIAGNRIYIAWNFENLLPEESSFVFVRFDKPLGRFPVWTVVVGPFLGIVVGIVSTIFFMKRKSRKTMKKLASIYLSDTQKLLLKVIAENEGRILQKEICAKTGFTKSRVSRNITPMIEQELVKREKWGRNYILTLTENGEKVIE
jgi:uncharacterized membrane protein